MDGNSNENPQMEMTVPVGSKMHLDSVESSQMEMTTSVGEMLSQFPESFSHENQGMLLTSSLGPVDESILNEINNVEEKTFDELIDSEKFKERSQPDAMEFTQAVGQLMIPNDSFEIPSFLYQIDSEVSFIASNQDFPKETTEKMIQIVAYHENAPSVPESLGHSNSEQNKELQCQSSQILSRF